MSTPALYHYTCSHSHYLIRGELRPNLGLVWLTDLDAAIRDALGLTSNILNCDRTKYRYRVTDATGCVPWMDWPGRSDRSDLELAPGARPMHWWVSAEPVPVAYDPIGGINGRTAADVLAMEVDDDAS